MEFINKNVKTIILLAIAATAVLFQACESNEDALPAVTQEEELDISLSSSSEEINSEEDVEYINALVALSASNGRLSNESCAVITRDREKNIITIDFGDGCTGSDGRIRSGKVIITYGGEFGDGKANRVITFDNYYINDNKITGAIELRNFNRNDQGNLTSSRKLVDYTINYPDGNTLTINANVTREWIEGEGDEDRSNNVFSLTGSYTGISTRGREFTRTIIEPVIVDFNCKASGGFIRVAGKIEMTIKGARGERTRTVDYGDGTCDNEYTISINGK